MPRKSYKRYYPQFKPEGLNTPQSFASATWNHASHDAWASRHVAVLHQLHRNYISPTQFGTIKANEILNCQVIDNFLYALRKKTDNFNRRNKLGQHIAYYAFPEIEESGEIHWHVHIRAYQVDPGPLLQGFIDQFNALHETQFSLWIEAYTDVEGAVVYSTKLGKKHILLFQSGSLARYFSTAGKYTVGIPVKELRQEYYLDYALRKAEAQVDDIVGYWDDAPTDPPTTPQANKIPCIPWQIFRCPALPPKRKRGYLLIDLPYWLAKLARAP